VDAVTAALQHPVGPFTVEDWHALDPRDDGSRLELLWGHWLVSPQPTGHHQHAGTELWFVLRTALRDVGRTDLYPVVAVGVEISKERRTVLAPDVVVLDIKPVGTSFQAENVVLAAEIWSPGNRAKERVDKAEAYAIAGIPHFWTMEQNRFGAVTKFTAYRLERGRYVEAVKAVPGTATLFDVAGVPVKFDPADLAP
jgi:Uma2 family endonuclease